jgi:transposase
LATVGSAGREGGRGPSALSPGQRWSVARKREVVLRLLRGEAAEDLSRELAVPVYRLERWRERALAGIEGALKEREGDPLKDELGAAMRRLGELTMENELLRARAERPGPLARRRSR